VLGQRGPIDERRFGDALKRLGVRIGPGAPHIASEGGAFKYFWARRTRILGQVEPMSGDIGDAVPAQDVYHLKAAVDYVVRMYHLVGL
jgi:hypothetical protein